MPRKLLITAMGSNMLSKAAFDIKASGWSFVHVEAGAGVQEMGVGGVWGTWKERNEMKVRGMEKTCYTPGYPFVRETEGWFIHITHTLREHYLVTNTALSRLFFLTYSSKAFMSLLLWLVSWVSSVACVCLLFWHPTFLHNAFKYLGLAHINHVSHILQPGNRAEETTHKQTPASPPGHDMNGLGFDQGQRDGVDDPSREWQCMRLGSGKGMYTCQMLTL